MSTKKWQSDGDQGARPGSPSEQDPTQELNRREFLRLGALAGAGALLAKSGSVSASGATAVPRSRIEEMTIAEMQAAMDAGHLTARALVNKYLARIEAIDRRGPKVNAVLEVNPDAREIARELDAERRRDGPRGPLHGIPILLKDNIDTADRTMTAAGSLALVGDPPAQDATVASRLREAGAILLGKANLSEWANFRSFHSSSGWSGRGGQNHNPYVLDRNPCGSSSGSASAVAANLCAAALGTETDGSVVCPSTANAVVGIKPTVGLTSRAGVVPISHTQDTVGVHGRTVADAAAVLGALVGVDPRDPATAASEGNFHTDYTQFLDSNGLQGARIGVPRFSGFFGYSEETDRVIEDAIQAIRDAGATVIDGVDEGTPLLPDFAEIVVLVYEFRRDLNAYLATRSGVPIQSLADAIAFNQAHADEELKFFLQEWFVFAEEDPFTEDDYLAALARYEEMRQDFDGIMDRHNLDAMVAPTGSPAWPTDLINGDHFLGASSSPAATAGYPLITVPAGFTFELPVGITFMARAYSEPTLIRLAYAFEQATQARQPPKFLRTLDLDDGDATAAAPGRKGAADLMEHVTNNRPAIKVPGR